MALVSLKADLHVHSKFSTRPSEWILQKLGCAESYTEPLTLYKTAIRQGMDLVTITDHNTIDGALEIAHLPNTFISEEVTAYFPEDNCKLHVLCYDISENQHQEIQRLRTNIYDLIDYFAAESIPHAMAHALYSLNGKLTPGHLERLILLFKTFELNGSRNAKLNHTLQDILTNLTPQAVDEMANKHDLTPRMPEAWQKHFIAGSDDHSSLNIARSYTEIRNVQQGEEALSDFIHGIQDGRSTPHGEDARPETMAHNLYSIAYQFYKNKFMLSRHVNRDLLLRFADRALTASPEPEGGWLTKLHGMIGFKRAKHILSKPPSNVQGLLQKEAEELIWNDQDLRQLVNSMNNSGVSTEQAWFSFVDHASEKVLKNLADSVLNNAASANLFSLFHTMGSAGSLYAILAPYFVAYSLFTKDTRYTEECRKHFLNEDGTPERLRIGHFTDTFYDVNGVARTLQMQLKVAKKTEKFLRVITCHPDKQTGHIKGLDGIEGVKNFTPVDTFSMPEYPELAVHYPPVLRMLQYAYEQNFTHLHTATPGPVGLIALAVARILQLPIHATYHTAFPQYVDKLTNDSGMEEAAWRYMIWFYNQMDVVYVPSLSTGDELVERGIPRHKIAFYPRGIDTEQFNPSFRNGFFKQYPEGATGHPDELRLLYVGRLSLEKNIHILADAFRLVAERMKGVRLVLVGDGPHRQELKKALIGLPVTFTGYLEGEKLSAAYASSDVFVFPSGTDTFGNVVLEAQASGLPVIVTDQGGPKENLMPETTGFIVPEGDAVALAEAILLMVSDREQLAAMQHNARTYTEGRSFEACFLHQWNMYRNENVA